MRLDHIAYRVRDKFHARIYFEKLFLYSLADVFQLQFDDGTTCECFAMKPPKQTPISRTIGGLNENNQPDIFISEGKVDSVVWKWIQERGPGIHHLAYEVRDVPTVMEAWKTHKVEFLSGPLECDDLIQVFTKPHPVTGMTYELIQKKSNKGFCKDNVKRLMESSDA